MHFNMYPAKVIVGIIAAALASLETNLLPLFLTVTVFEIIDFVTGVIKSYVTSKRKGERFAFESVKAWRTIYKFVFILIGIMLAEMLDHTIAAETRLRFANYFTGFCCGIELWSFLENAAVISEHPLFLWLRKFMKFKVEDQMGMTLEEAKKKRPVKKD